MRPRIQPHPYRAVKVLLAAEPKGGWSCTYIGEDGNAVTQRIKASPGQPLPSLREVLNWLDTYSNALPF